MSQVLDKHTEVHADAALIGAYGAHSAQSRACAALFDDTVGGAKAGRRGWNVA